MVTQIGNSLLLYFGNIMKNFERSRIFFVVLHGILDFFAVVLLSWTYDDMKSTLTDFLSIMWTLYISISATSLFLMMYVMIKPENSVIKSYMIFTEKFHENTLINIILYIQTMIHFLSNSKIVWFKCPFLLISYFWRAPASSQRIQSRGRQKCPSPKLKS